MAIRCRGLWASMYVPDVHVAKGLRKYEFSGVSSDYPTPSIVLLAPYCMGDRTISFKTEYLRPYDPYVIALYIRHGYPPYAGLGTVRGVWGQNPPQGDNFKFSKFSKKNFYLSTYRPRTTTIRYLGPVPTIFTSGTPGLGGTVRELGAPKHVIFVDYISPILCRNKINLRVTSRKRSLSRASTFAIFRTGGKGVRIPPNLPPKIFRFFKSIFDPLRVPPQKFHLLP